jgi:hypothetical protein
MNSRHIDLKSDSKENKATQMKAYLDDLTAGIDTFREMMILLEKLFSLCRELQLKLHPDQCFLFLKKIRVLEHVLTKEGIHPLNKILRRIRSSRRPENKDQVRDFLGLAGYYQSLQSLLILFKFCYLKMLRFRGGRARKFFCAVTKLAFSRQFFDSSRQLKSILLGNRCK